MMMKAWRSYRFVVSCLLLISTTSMAQSETSKQGLKSGEEVLFRPGLTVRINVDPTEAAVLKTALSLLQKDVRAVFDAELQPENGAKEATIIAGTLGRNEAIDRLVRSGNITVSGIRGKWESFILKTIVDQGKKKLLIIGSDSRGTAYGLMELSRLLGVSPWEWWADATPEKRAFFAFPKALLSRSPSVQYRGIFLNDEDWGLMPWSSKTYEPGLATVGKTKGAIGPKSYAKIFELLLRLRANTIWPAMHEVTVPFYFSKGNKEMADQYGIVVGTSHCEPLMRNSATEWDIAGKGDYNYKSNKDAILSYWTERLKELKGSENIYTIGLRGKHDGMMQGVKGLKEHQEVLARVIKDQRDLLATYVNKDLTKVPQVFIPYKEVLDVYNNGLQVPDDVTLIWCDDNYGYLTHFPDENERKRSGGNGIYYHLSYWGRPHDYLWLGTVSPALLAQQMQLAYEKGARKQWIVNVGDIKPTEYQMELFLDMAWDIDDVRRKGSSGHLGNWLEREFGKVNAAQLLKVMQEHYRLAFIRKPEFMGNSRTEEKDPKYKMVSDLPWTEREIRKRLSDYGKLEDQIGAISVKIPLSKRDAFFQLLEYPVSAAAEMNKKLLYAQLARHGKADWELSERAFELIRELTARYNTMNNGKWKGIMNDKPRDLAVFQQLPKDTAGAEMIADEQPLQIQDGVAYKSFSGTEPLRHGLGYQNGAVSLSPAGTLSYEFAVSPGDRIRIDLAFIPSHPVSGKQLRCKVTIDGKKEQLLNIYTEGRTEEWKKNVLTNRTVRSILEKVSGHKISVEVSTLDEGMILDQIMIYKQ